MIKMTHSLIAYFVLFLLVIVLIKCIAKLISKKEFTARDRKLALYVLVISHIQFLVGLVAYFNAPYFQTFKDKGMKVMSNSELRRILIEHPFAMLLAVILITIGFSKHKKKTTSKAKFVTLTVFYSLALLLILGMIPWAAWLGN